jgi:hypothetical protein
MATATVGVKTVAQAKAARQKKIAIIGAVLLVGIMAIQGPKLMKQLKGSSSTPTAAPATPAAPVAPVTPATPSTPATPATPASTDRLASFDTFSSKDPFAQQVTAETARAQATETSGSSSSGSGSGGTSASDSSGSGSSDGSSGSATTGTASTKEPAGGTLAASAGFSVAGSETTPPASQQFASASLRVNTAVETVDEGKTFPRSDPVFKLVKVTDGAVEISIADGSLGTGAKTLSITTGKPMTLKNTTTGKKYKVEVVSTSPKS